MTSGDLFGAGAGTGADAAYPALDLPLAVRMRPRSLAEVRGQEAVLGVVVTVSSDIGALLLGSLPDRVSLLAKVDELVGVAAA